MDSRETRFEASKPAHLSTGTGGTGNLAKSVMRERSAPLLPDGTPMPGDHDTIHGACGKTWKQRGNRTGHCSGCHETFEGEKLFDAHRITLDDGERGCADPRSMEWQGEPLRIENGTWRGPKMSTEARERYRAV